MWNFVINIGIVMNGDWCIGGDFNNELKVDDRVYGNFIMDFEIVDIKEFMDKCGIIEMKDFGRYYIWFNGYVCFKIDGMFCNLNWICDYGYIVVEFREVYVLDYFFVFVNICKGRYFKRLFRFVNFFIY